MERLGHSLLVLVTVCLMGCNYPIQAALLSGNGSSGIEGQVLIGPTCPVMRENDPNCADKPYPTTLGLYQNGQLLARLVTDDQGRFKVSLEPGTYTLETVVKVSHQASDGPSQPLHQQAYHA
ncbi:prealbumin-like fold domain-containing protein [Allomeiothermus silvanus]|uniref:prealbumin-like fold domain-containing protein n=1 Tax=Allomeiothermus silvanus TaxID=52022 RepID=UPI0005A02AFA|nr:prealbumin-like fold domain-containing protein [Allomeiothermus silvanus]